MDEDYTDIHRFFLQEMMTVGILDAFDVKNLYASSHKAFNADADERNLHKFIKAIKVKIQPLGMDIRKWHDEDGWKKGRGKTTFYVLTCSTERSCAEFPLLASKAMPDFTPKEVEYLKLIMRNILTSDQREIRRQEALNLTLELSGTNRLSMSDAEKTILAFKARKWVKFCPRQENIRLTARFLAEMQSYLLNLRNKALEAEDDDHPGAGVNICPATGCNLLVIRGYSCGSCDKTFHLYCVTDQDGTGQETHGRCPKCQVPMELRGGGGGQSSSSSRGHRQQEPVKRKRISRMASSSSEDEGQGGGQEQEEEMEY